MDERAGTEIRGEIDALRRRLDEQASMLKRTSAAVSSLADSLGEMVARQRRSARSLNLNSFVAYTLFTVLLGGGFFALYHARAGDLLAARDAAVVERDRERERAQELADAVAQREAGERAAHDFYLLTRDGEASEVVARYAEIEQAPLTETERAVFAERVKRARAVIVDAGYLSGLDAFRAGAFDRAKTSLQSALAYEEEGPRAAQMRYFLGVSLLRVGEPEAGAHQLELALVGRVDRAGITDARFHLAESLESAGDIERARAEYEKFATAHPVHAKTIAARRKAAQLARQLIRAPTN